MSLAALPRSTDPSEKSPAGAPEQGRASAPRPYLAYPDLLRIVAILAVIVVHVSSGPLKNSKPGSADWWVDNLFGSAARFCVPLFVMISGMLLLDPAKREPLGQFLRKRLAKVAIPLMAWSVIYYLWFIFLNNFAHHSFSLKTFVLETLNLGTCYHLYFMYKILGLYLATPVLRAFLRAADKTLVTYFLGLWFAFMIVGVALDRFCGVRIGIENIVFSSYVGYYVGGLWLHQLPLRRRKLCLILSGAAIVLSILVTAAGNYYVAVHKISPVDLYYSYFTLNVLVMSVAIFLFFKALDPAWALHHAKVLRKISAAVFGVYLIHILVMSYAAKFVFAVGLGRLLTIAWVNIPVMTVLVFLVSLGVVLILKKIPLLKYIVP